MHNQKLYPAEIIWKKQIYDLIFAARKGDIHQTSADPLRTSEDIGRKNLEKNMSDITFASYFIRLLEILSLNHDYSLRKKLSHIELISAVFDDLRFLGNLGESVGNLGETPEMQ